MSTTKNTKSGFTAEERAAMKARAKELKAQANKAEALATAVAAIEAMPAEERAIAHRVHDLILETAPELMAKTWYGQPAYANEEGQVVVFFQGASKFGTRYSTLGFNEAANLDDGGMWATSFAISALTPADEKRIVELVKKAVS
jgi:uncharacterized protein YdhG (YjbR/CyaY superfamily)